MYLLHLIAYLPCITAYQCLKYVPLLSNHHPDSAKNERLPGSFGVAPLPAIQISPSPAASCTENTTTSAPTVEKEQVADTEDKFASMTLQDPSECPEHEELECKDCGGQIYDRTEGLYRCIGEAETDYFKWKDCFCLPEDDRRIIPFEDNDPTPAEIAEVFYNLPDWTSDSWSKSPPGYQLPQNVTLRREGKREDINDEATGAGT